MKRSFPAMVILLSLAVLSSSSRVANAGPFRNFFRALRSAMAQPQESSRRHTSSRTSYKHNETPPSDASDAESSGSAVPASGRTDVRSAKAVSGANQQKSGVYGTPVPGKPGFVTSPFAP